MTTAIAEARVKSHVMKDGARRDCDAPDLTELASELTNALNGALWSYMLRAELEDALDTALFRAAMAETPTLSGAGPFSIAS
jgi:hypothetical protein